MQLQHVKVVNKADRMGIADIGHKRFEFGTVSRCDNHRWLRPQPSPSPPGSCHPAGQSQP